MTKSKTLEQVIEEELFKYSLGGTAPLLKQMLSPAIRKFYGERLDGLKKVYNEPKSAICSEINDTVDYNQAIEDAKRSL